MDKLITINHIELTEVKTLSVSPTTKVRSKISKQNAKTLEGFSKNKKAAISEEEIKKIKPEFDTSKLSSYEEILTLDKLKNKLTEINKILKEDAHAELCLSYDNIAKLFDNNNSENNINNEEDEKKLSA